MGVPSMTDVVRQEVVRENEGVMPSRTWKAPEGSGELVLGRTIVSLLDEAWERNCNPCAFNQSRGDRWETLSTEEFRLRAEKLALALRTRGLGPGERVALFCQSDLSFTLPDMACLLAGLVTVPIYLTHASENVAHIVRESESRAVFVTDARLLSQIEPLLRDSLVRLVVVMEGPLPAASDVPGLELSSAQQLLARGGEILREDPDAAVNLRAGIGAKDLATIIYTSGTTGVPKGVMLSHENISSNAIASFTALKGYQRGAAETVLSFLPLTHIFARTLQYGCMWYGNTVYYSDAERLRDHFQAVRPTMLATVPRVLEKAYERIMETGSQLTGIKRRIFDWSMALADRYRVGQEPHGIEGMRFRLADKLVLSKWREALGGRMRYLIVGAAPLRSQLVNLFGAAGIHVLQGYGLTESSPVISFNRPDNNRPGTVGIPIAGVEVALGQGNEILVRGPNVMQGYYKNPDATARAIRNDWLHTGDVGEVDEEGFISLTGRIKSIFKLSTGKYVMPQPLEQRLEAQPLIEHALVVGEGEKYCSALLFLGAEALDAYAERAGVDARGKALLHDERLQAKLKRAVIEANSGLPHWSCVKKAVLALGDITIDNGFLTPTLKLRREPVVEAYRPVVEALYRPGTGAGSEVAVLEL